MLIEALLIWYAILGVLFAIVLSAFIGMGVLLLIDLVFKTTFGRRAVRRLINFYKEA